MTPQVALERGLRQLALPVPEQARGQLLRYIELLAKWNRTYNLTAVRTPGGMVTHHLLDSLAVVPHLPMLRPQMGLADVGSGAGLPGIPIAIVRPQWHVVLVESSEKKSAFLRQAAIELSLANLQVHTGRVEQWRPGRCFSLVISRAFAELASFISACRHLLEPGGLLAAMKGRFPTHELSGLPQDCCCSPPLRLRVPMLEAERHLVLCRLGS